MATDDESLTLPTTDAINHRAAQLRRQAAQDHAEAASIDLHTAKLLHEVAGLELKSALARAGATEHAVRHAQLWQRTAAELPHTDGNR